MRLPLAVCRVCAYENDAASPIRGEDDRPKPGDVCLCLNCGEVSLYGPDMLPRVPLWHELADIPSEAYRAAGLIRRRGRIH
jgi:hypothetical protein